MQKAFILILLIILPFANELNAQANAGPDRYICGDTISMQADDPYPMTGQWSVLAGEGTFENLTLFNSFVSEIAEGENIYHWEVTDGENTYFDDVEITSYPIPYVYFVPGTNITRFPDSDIKFVNYSDNNLATYVWDFGDGSSPVIQTYYSGQIDHAFTTWGTFEVTLTGSNSASCNNSWSETIEILPPCAYSYTEPSLIARGCQDLAVEFRAYVQWADTFEWKFYGDNMFPDSISNEEIAIHTYTEPGEYYPVLRAWNEGCEVVYYRQDTVLVYTKPIVDFDVVLLPNKAIRCFNYSQYGERFLWDFGDTISFEEEPFHSYQEAGVFDISLTVWTEHHCFDSLIIRNLAIDEEEQNDPTVFPNPFKERFYISTKDILIDPEIFIYDLTGRQVNAEIEMYSDKLIFVDIKNPKGDTFILKLVNNNTEFTYRLFRK